MLPGLMLTSLATLVVGTTLFQRRARNGWVDELEGVRGEALLSPEDEIGSAMGSGIAGEASDDEPETLRNHAWMKRARTAAAEAEANGQGVPVEDVAADLRSKWEPAPEVGEVDLVADIRPEPATIASPVAPSDPPPPPPPAAAVDPIFETGPADPTFGQAANAGSAGAAVPAPAPHRDRPHEMWHQGATVTSLSNEVNAQEERVSSASLVDDSDGTGRSRFDRFRPVEVETPLDDEAAASAWSSPADDAVNDFMEPPLVPFTPDPSSGGLLSGPVGRRRRDDARQPLPTPQPTAGPTSQPTVPVAVSASGEVEIDAPIVRLGQGSRAMVRSGAGRLTVSIQAGSCWVSPLGTLGREVRILLGGVDLSVGAGACALAVAEADGSVFVIAASGVVDATIGETRRTLEPGTMVLIPAGGEAQVDQARPEEIESDPIVAHNRELDSTRNR